MELHTLIRTSRFPIKLTVTAAIVLTFTACSPARWSENNGPDSSNTGSGNPDPGGPRSPSAKTAVETFDQDSTANKVDILIVNDNSGSMEFEQSKMSVRFSSFISDMKGIDYRIAMTTTDIDSAKFHQDGKIMPWSGTSAKILTPSTKDAEIKFKNTIYRSETIGCLKRTDCPSGNEQPLRATELAIDQAKTANADLFRSGVDFVVVVLSDEDEMSTAPVNSTTAAHVVQHFKDVFGDTKRLAVHGIVVEPGDDACLKEQAAQNGGTASAFGTRVAELSSLTAGSLHSICDRDYAKDLSAISTSVRKLISSFDLHEIPRDGSVSVVLSPKFKTTWAVEQNRIVFNPAPPAGTKIEVTYQY